MAIYIYPAIFTVEADGGYSVAFPDIESCYTQGDDLGDAMEMAEDVLALMLYGYEKEGRTIPSASAIDAVKTSGQEFVSLVKADTMEYRKRFNNKAVKKTLTIPEWLNEEATAKHINFSKLLQNALIEKLDIRQ